MAYGYENTDREHHPQYRQAYNPNTKSQHTLTTQTQYEQPPRRHQDNENKTELTGSTERLVAAFRSPFVQDAAGTLLCALLTVVGFLSGDSALAGIGAVGSLLFGFGISSSSNPTENPQQHAHHPEGELSEVEQIKQEYATGELTDAELDTKLDAALRDTPTDSQYRSAYSRPHHYLRN